MKALSVLILNAISLYTIMVTTGLIIMMGTPFTFSEKEYAMKLLLISFICGGVHLLTTGITCRNEENTKSWPRWSIWLNVIGSWALLMTMVYITTSPHLLSDAFYYTLTAVGTGCVSVYGVLITMRSSTAYEKEMEQNK